MQVCYPLQFICWWASSVLSILSFGYESESLCKFEIKMKNLVLRAYMYIRPCVDIRSTKSLQYICIWHIFNPCCVGRGLQCVLPQNCCLNLIISKSKQAACLKLGNLRQKVVLYKTGKFFQVSMAHMVCKLENKKTNHTDFT